MLHAPSLQGKGVEHSSAFQRAEALGCGTPMALPLPVGRGFPPRPTRLWHGEQSHAREIHPHPGFVAATYGLGELANAVKLAVRPGKIGLVLVRPGGRRPEVLTAAGNLSASSGGELRRGRSTAAQW